MRVFTVLMNDLRVTTSYKYPKTSIHVMKAVSTEAQFIFEDGQVGQRNETGAELMEVDQYDPQTKALTTLGQYSQYQVDHQQASDEINEESNTQVSAGGLMELFDKDQAATIKDAIEELSANFEGIKIGSTAVHDFLKVDMNFTIKRAVFHADKRNNEESVEERYRWATEIANSDVNFFRNCIFIDESGFHVNLKRTGAWGPKGKTPIIEVENSQAVSHTILGAISVYGVIHTS
ncbi:hypothetical protein G6F70_007515 [Rhizopus microsporus]|nr:hypothetical protein G6F71_007173 [Rhizopus microsporus]KAG1196364.1 hypothetical protein G6F70_007515 [Rhizopus microsporus]KAG1229847.1 hypothetical protein G6F67_006877 [Rhizopus microsporus]KAG1261279.1 hypothetical protein G6F68_006814 [Rhizopus microsporus]